MAEADATLSGRHVLIVSRCASTMWIFRRGLVAALVAAGARVTCAGGGADPATEARITGLGARYRRLPDMTGRPRLLGELGMLAALSKLFAAERPELVHLFTIRPVIYGGLAGLAARAPVMVATITGLGHAFTTAGSGLRALVRGLYRAALRRMDLVHFQNPEDRALFVDAGLVKPAHSRLVPGSGVDLAAFAPAPPPPQPPLTFVMIARLLVEKGVHEYFDACAQLRRDRDARCLLVGGVDPRNPSSLNWEDAVAAATAAGVELVGPVDDVRPWIAQAHVVVLPSYREGLPRTLIEACAMARPMIATDVPGCRDVVADGVNGLLVPVRDAAALAVAMRACIDGAVDLEAFGRAARAQAEARYDEQALYRVTLADYARLLRRARSRRGRPSSALPPGG